MASRLIPLAEVARPHGVRGELRVKLYHRDSNLLQALSEVILRHPDGEENLVKIVRVQRANGAMLVHIEGCEDRTHAEELRGAQILVPREVFPPLEEGEFYVCDLMGAKVIAPEGEVGEVEGFLSYPTCDALVIRTPVGRTELPLVDGLVDAIDVAGGVVRVPRRDPLGEE
ncbi:MAG: ribosome maturation factor RimM [Myxococcales bacterium]|nr:ribosome maturation factor RimM [Polyangiaceae bacterium]MDW8251026.1 ribosome maturation factor RimM [Myxococcales bacterium]